MKRYIYLLAFCFYIFFVLCLFGVGCFDNNGNNGACSETNVSIAVCDPEAPVRSR